MYTNELIPRPDAAQAVNDYALLYTKVEGSKQYVRKLHYDGLNARNAFIKATRAMILWLIPTVLLAMIAMATFPEENIVGLIFAALTVIVIFKWSGRRIMGFLKALKQNAFSKACAAELMDINRSLNGTAEDVWTDAFRDETVKLVNDYMYRKYDAVNKRIALFNKKYGGYRDFVNLDNQWNKSPYLADIFNRGLATSIVEALREYERKKDAEEIKGMQRSISRSLEQMAGEVQKISSEVKSLDASMAANTAAQLAQAEAIKGHTDAVKELSDKL